MRFSRLKRAEMCRHGVHLRWIWYVRLQNIVLMMIVRSKMGFDPDFNLRRWLYALDFREPPPEISVFLFKSKVGSLVWCSGRAWFSLFSHHSFVSRLFLCDKIINCCTHLTLFACYKITDVRRKRCNIGCWNLGFKQDRRFRRFVLLKSTCWEFCEYKCWWRSINVKWRQCK